MHFPNYKKAVCLFFKPAFNFLSVDIVDATVFILLWGEGLGFIIAALQFEWTCVAKVNESSW